MPRSTRSRLRFATGLLAGLVLSVPLAVSGSFVGAAATRHFAEATPPVQAATPAAQVAVNRDAKRSRLPLPVTGNGTPAVVDTVRDAATSIVSKGTVISKEEIPRAAKPRSHTTPKGCLSALGGLSSNVASEELTVCVADMSLVAD